MNFRKKLLRIFSKNYRSISEITINEALELQKQNKNVYIVDVRSNQEFKEKHLPNAINIPFYEINCNVNNIIKNKEDIIILYCRTGMRSKQTAEILEKCGYKNVYNVKGGIQ